MRRLATVSLADQILANASNALVVLAVAGASSPAQFGTFTITYATLAFVIGLERSLLATPISLAADAPGVAREETTKALGLLLLSSPLTVALVLLASGIWSGHGSAPAVLVAVSTPIVLSQDVLRFGAVALGRPKAAFWADLLWLVFAGAAFGAQAIGAAGSTFVAAVWAAGGLASLLLLLVLLGVRPSTNALRPWLAKSKHWRLQVSLGAAAMSASVPVALAIFSVLGGTSAVAAVGGAGQLMAPVNTLTAFVGYVLLARVAGETYARKVRLCRIAGLGLAGVSVIWGLALLAMPDQWGVVLLGETWTSTRAVIPVVGVQYAISGLAFAATLLLTSSNRPRAVMTTGFAVATGRLVLVTGAGLLGVTAWYLVVAESLTMAVWLGAAMGLVRRTRTQRGSHRD